MSSIKKYELTSETINHFGITLYRIKALIDFSDVSAGDLGGYIEKEDNLSHENNAWVYGDARVCGNAEVCGNARVYGNADIYWISSIGSRGGTTTFFKSKENKIMVSCGCFTGDLGDFEKAVEKTHGDNEHGGIYKLAIEIAKIKIKLGE